MYGMDISNHQGRMDLRKGTYDFCIIKATEGIGYTDKSFHNFSVQLTEMDKLIGCYHFARPDLHGTVRGMEDEADWFLKCMRDEGLLKRAILVLDWEREPMYREDLINAWILRVENQTGITPFVYGSRSKLTSWKSWWALSHCPIWMAAWPTIKRLQVGTDPGLTIPSKTIAWDIWQYSSTGTYPDFTGNVDLDYCELSKEKWLSMAGYEEPTVEEIINKDMQWAIDSGLFVGYGNGLYGPKESLTREQAATLFRVYTEKFIKK